jgi:predicted dithiol-disulfide oxidoreductase (DUF899 family)
MGTVERRGQLEELEQRIRADQAKRRELLREEGGAVEDCTLLGWGGPVRLSELFGGRSDLLLVHNMGSGCPYCTLWADGFNGTRAHLENRAAFVVCSPDPPPTQQRFAEARGWGFQMVQDPDGVFTREMGYLEERDGKRFHQPGVSAFHLEPDGRIRRVAHDAFGPGDPYCGTWHLFELLEGGVAGWQPRFRYD